MTALPPDEDWFGDDDAPRIHGALRWCTYLALFWALAALAAGLAIELWRNP